MAVTRIDRKSGAGAPHSKMVVAAERWEFWVASCPRQFDLLSYTQ
jgi:hypothetical protein